MGAYTGNAIASIACSEGVAVVDANVVRVIARLRRMAGDPRAAAKQYAALADALLDPERPGCFNQVLIPLVTTALFCVAACTSCHFAQDVEYLRPQRLLAVTLTRPPEGLDLNGFLLCMT